MGKLTQKLLESLTEEHIGKRLFDGKGLYGKVRLQKRGVVVTFEYRYMLDRKQKSSSCGTWPKKTLKNIRKLRDDKYDAVEERIDINLANIKDRADTKKQQLEDANNAIAALNQTASRTSFSEAIHKWVANSLSSRKDSGTEALRRLNKDVLPKLGSIALEGISKAMILEATDQIVSRGASVIARHVIGDLQQFFSYATDRDWVETNPLDKINKKNIGAKSKPRQRHLQIDEIKELAEKLPKSKLAMHHQHAIWIMLSTCCRVGELMQAQWKDIDYTNSTWTIPIENTKGEHSEHIVHLSDFAKDQFLALHLVTMNETWCFPNKTGTEHIDLKTTAKQIRDRTTSKAVKGRPLPTQSLLLSKGEWTPHDLRRSGATLMGELGISSDIIERCLHHAEPNVLVRTYQHHQARPLMITAWNILSEELSSQLYNKPAKL